jgi:hypothetical protein
VKARLDPAAPLAVWQAGMPFPERVAAREAKRMKLIALVSEVDGIVDEVDFFFGVIEKCRDPDDLEILARWVGSQLAPMQLRQLYQRVERLCPRDTTVIFRQRAPGWMLFQRRETPRFINTRLSSHARLFESEGAAREEKVLLVLLSAIDGGVLVAISRLLARLPERRFDVLWLRPHDEGEYPSGVPGIGTSFRAVCDALRQRAAGYAGAGALGASLGGLAALRAALLGNLGVGVSLGGRFTRFDPGLTAFDVASYDPLCGCSPRPPARLLAYFSEENMIDSRSAAMLQAMVPGVELMPVQNSGEHNVMVQLAGSGELDRIFTELDTAARRRP